MKKSNIEKDKNTLETTIESNRRILESSMKEDGKILYNDAAKEGYATTNIYLKKLKTHHFSYLEKYTTILTDCLLRDLDIRKLDVEKKKCEFSHYFDDFFNKVENEFFNEFNRCYGINDDEQFKQEYADIKIVTFNTFLNKIRNVFENLSEREKIKKQAKYANVKSWIAFVVSMVVFIKESSSWIVNTMNWIKNYL